MGRLPLEQLEAFVCAARLGNLTRAAEAMNLTVSALSHRMRQLEQRMGQVLLQRGPRGVALTLAGQRLLDDVGEPLDRIAQALRRRAAVPGNTVTLSLTPSMANAWLVSRLPQLVAAHPQLSLSLQSSAHLVDFEREPVDLALRLGRGQWPGVQAEFLFDEWISPVASPELLARHGKVPLARLAELPLLGDPGGRWPQWFARFGGEPPARYVAHLDDSEALHHAAATGMGVALARLTLAQPLIAAGRLVRLTRRRLKPDFAHYLVYPERSLRHPGAVLVCDWLRQQATQMEAP